MASSLRNTLLAVGTLAVLFGTAMADPNGEPAQNSGDVIMPPPPVYQANSVTVVEHLGTKLPLDARFRVIDLAGGTIDGKTMTLGEVLAGDLPSILTFNYADCPMLCSQMLNGLVNGLPVAAKPGPLVGADGDVAFNIGKQFRIVTIALDPGQAVEKTRAMRARYAERVPGGAVPDRGWTFLVPELPGDATQIQRVADAVGFNYTYIEDRAEWAHPAAFVFLSSAGAITRYVYGVAFEGDSLRESIFKAGLAEASTATGFMFRCYHYDPGAKDHSRAGVIALRIGAASCIVLLAGFGFALLRKRNGSRGDRRREVT